MKQSRKRALHDGNSIQNDKQGKTSSMHGSSSRKKKKKASVARRKAPGTSKRYLWRDELHERFLAGIFDLALDKVTAEDIMLKMKPVVPGLKLSHIEKHLLEYRKYATAARAEYLLTFISAVIPNWTQIVRETNDIPENNRDFFAKLGIYSARRAKLEWPNKTFVPCQLDGLGDIIVLDPDVCIAADSHRLKHIPKWMFEYPFTATGTLRKNYNQDLTPVVKKLHGTKPHEDDSIGNAGRRQDNVTKKNRSTRGSTLSKRGYTSSGNHLKNAPPHNGNANTRKVPNNQYHQNGISAMPSGMPELLI
eukprot:g313.t1